MTKAKESLSITRKTKCSIRLTTSEIKEALSKYINDRSDGCFDENCILHPDINGASLTIKVVQEF